MPPGTPGRRGVFAGTFGLPAAEAVYGDAGAPGEAEPPGLVIDILNALVDSSLVQPETHGKEPRFGLLETIREYALGRLRASGAWEEVHDRHAAYFMALAMPAESELQGEGQLAWLNRLETEVGVPGLLGEPCVMRHHRGSGNVLSHQPSTGPIREGIVIANTPFPTRGHRCLTLEIGLERDDHSVEPATSRWSGR